MEKTQGREHPDIAQVANNIGVVLQDLNRLDEALVSYQRSEQLVVRVLGPHHPLRSVSLVNEAEVLNALHRYDEAQVRLDQAMEIWRHAGSNPYFVALTLTNLGETLLGQGRLHEARSRLEEAIKLFPRRTNALHRGRPIQPSEGSVGHPG